MVRLIEFTSIEQDPLISGHQTIHYHAALPFEIDIVSAHIVYRFLFVSMRSIYRPLRVHTLINSPPWMDCHIE